jgi:hypothetical protein
VFQVEFDSPGIERDEEDESDWNLRFSATRYRNKRLENAKAEAKKQDFWKIKHLVFPGGD